jgi:hypothetical protein
MSPASLETVSSRLQIDGLRLIGLIGVGCDAGGSEGGSVDDVEGCSTSI